MKWSQIRFGKYYPLFGTGRVVLGCEAGGREPLRSPLCYIENSLKATAITLPTPKHRREQVVSNPTNISARSEYGTLIYRLDITFPNSDNNIQRQKMAGIHHD